MTKKTNSGETEASLSQQEVDDLLSGKRHISDESEATLSQDEVDQLLSGKGSSSKSSDNDDGKISQDEIDNILSGIDSDSDDSDLLPQDEIDKLLDNISSDSTQTPAINARSISIYDFGRPDILTHAQRNYFERSMTDILRTVSATVSQIRNKKVILKSAATDMLTDREWSRSVVSPSNIYLVKTNIGNLVLNFDCRAGQLLLKQNTDKAEIDYLDTKILLNYFAGPVLKDILSGFEKQMNANSKKPIEKITIKSIDTYLDTDMLPAELNRDKVVLLECIEVGNGKYTDNAMIDLVLEGELVQYLIDHNYFSPEGQKNIQVVADKPNLFVELGRFEIPKEKFAAGDKITLPVPKYNPFNIVYNDKRIGECEIIVFDNAFGARVVGIFDEKSYDSLDNNKMIVRFGSCYRSEGEIKNLDEGSILTNIAQIGSDVEILINNKTAAYAKLEIIDDNFVLNITK